MIWMEKQLESLTELVKELTRERALNEKQLSSRTAIFKGTLNIDQIFIFDLSGGEKEKKL